MNDYRTNLLFFVTPSGRVILTWILVCGEGGLPLCFWMWQYDYNRAWHLNVFSLPFLGGSLPFGGEATSFCPLLVMVNAVCFDASSLIKGPIFFQIFKKGSLPLVRVGSAISSEYPSLSPTNASKVSMYFCQNKTPPSDITLARPISREITSRFLLGFEVALW